MARLLHKFEITSFGYRLTLGGKVTLPEATQLKTELADLLAIIRKPYGVIADVRTVIPFSPEVKTLIRECEQMSKEAGLQRRAVIFQSPVVAGQATQLSFQSKTDDIERRIDASLTDNWEELALAWIVDGVEPLHIPMTDRAPQKPH